MIILIIALNFQLHHIVTLLTANYIEVKFEVFTILAQIVLYCYTINGENGEVYNKPAAAKPSN